MEALGGGCQFVPISGPRPLIAVQMVRNEGGGPVKGVSIEHLLVGIAIQRVAENGDTPCKPDQPDDCEPFLLGFHAPIERPSGVGVNSLGKGNPQVQTGGNLGVARPLDGTDKFERRKNNYSATFRAREIVACQGNKGPVASASMPTAKHQRQSLY